jgi:hypothetical protein
MKPEEKRLEMYGGMWGGVSAPDRINWYLNLVIHSR